MIVKGKISVVVGAQFGSEGKGAVAARLATEAVNPDRHVVAVRVAGPNAGHTVVDAKGLPWALRQVPVAAVSNPHATLIIAAGSEIDQEVLDSEVDALDKAGFEVSTRLVIDPQATILTAGHKAQEAANNLVGRIGSTGKGIGAARADRLMRTAQTWGDVHPEAWNGDSTALLHNYLLTGAHIVIEGTQGFGLGLHAGFYPKCTSSDTRAIDFLAMTGVMPWDPAVGEFEVWAVARTFPIRVAGDSGPLAGETTWEQLGLMPELTTVTKKVRRVGEWDPDLVWRAVQANGGAPTVRLALTMVDYIYPEIANMDGPVLGRVIPKDVLDYLSMIEDQTGARIGLVGTSASTMLHLPTYDTETVDA